MLESSMLTMTVVAADRLAWCGLERHFTFSATVRADRLVLLARALSKSAPLKVAHGRILLVL